MRLLLTGLIVVNFFRSCFGQSPANTKVDIGGCDVSRDDKTVLLACRDSTGRSIYSLDLNTLKTKLLVPSTPSLSFFNPVYSPDEKKIVFIGYFNKNANNSAIFTANSDGSNLKQLTAGNEIIKQAIFSKYDSCTILYIKANVYTHYSPIGVSQPHDMDIYTLNLENNSSTNITNLKAYALYTISELDSSYLLLTLPGGDNGGMFYYNKRSKALKRIEPDYDSRVPSYIFGTPKYSEQFAILGFKSTYHLYTMNLENKKAKYIYRTKKGQGHIVNFVFFHSDRKMLFYTNENGLYMIDLDGTNYREIDFGLAR